MRLLAIFAVWHGMSGMALQAQTGADPVGLVRHNSAFAIALYRQLQATEANLFFAPYSLSALFATLHAGARGNTARQIADVFHFASHDSARDEASARLNPSPVALPASEQVTLYTAQALWVQRDIPILPDFDKWVQRHGDASLHQVDFRYAHEAARAHINAWVKQQTQGHIQEPLQPDILNALTRLVLVNAIYFKGRWASPFDPRKTEVAPFRRTVGTRVMVPMMSQTQTLHYAETEALQILQLPYAGHAFSMIVLLTKALNGLAGLENTLTVQRLDDWITQLRPSPVRVWLPRFSVAAQLPLKQTLATMGMPDAFNETADFSGMNGDKSLFVSQVLHQAVVEVGEAGAEATAATTGIMQSQTRRAMPSVVFRADHPFLFLIRDHRSGRILFLGRL
ncbi:hypothetical protein C2W62_29145, partial [Candidatus Entotheonella serta]